MCAQEGLLQWANRREQQHDRRLGAAPVELAKQGGGGLVQAVHLVRLRVRVRVRVRVEAVHC